MIPNNNSVLHEDTIRTEQEENKPNAYRVDDDDNLEESDLKRSFLFGDSETKSTNDPGMEGKAMGGQKFGENNITPAGNDAANPSQLVGNNNEYFRRTQPAEEHPENSNFKPAEQQGSPDYNKSIKALNTTEDGEQAQNQSDHDQSPHPQQPYQQGTADDDGDNNKTQPNIPGPSELPDQQKVGE